MPMLLNPLRAYSTPVLMALLGGFAVAHEIPSTAVPFELQPAISDAGRLLVTIPFETESRTLVLTPSTVRSDRFRILVVDTDGIVTPMLPPPSRTLEGYLLEEADSVVRATYDGVHLDAIIWRSSGTWVLQSLAKVGMSSFARDHVCYRAGDVELTSSCGGALLPGTAGGPVLAGPPGTASRLYEVAADTSATYVSSFPQATVEERRVAAIEEIEFMISSASLPYLVSGQAPDEINPVILELSGIVLRDDPDDYSAPACTPTPPVVCSVPPCSPTPCDVWLDEIRSQWSPGEFPSITRDVVHLFIGEDIPGPSGKAFFESACDPVVGACWSTLTPESQPSVLPRSNTTAHELGHTLGAVADALDGVDDAVCASASPPIECHHCDSSGAICRIMCGVGPCDPLDPYEFGPPAVESINAFLAGPSSSCLTDAPAPLTIPFIDLFQSLDAWIFQESATLSGAVFSTPFTSLRVQGQPMTGDPLVDQPGEVRSAPIIAESSSDLYLSFRALHQGVEEGETLTAQYLATDVITDGTVTVPALVWRTAREVFSTGIDQSEFGFHWAPLPADAQHDNLRIRLVARSNRGTDTSDDYWYVDNVRLEEGPPSGVTIVPSISSIAPSRSSKEGGIPFEIQGSGFTTDATVSLGTEDVSEFVVFSDVSISGTVPASTQEGDVDVVVTQSGGVDTLSDGFEYTIDEVYNVVAPVFFPMQPFAAETFASHDEDLAGFSLGVRFRADSGPSVDVDVTEITVTGTEVEGAEFVAVQSDNDDLDGGWWTIGVVLQLEPRFTPLAQGTDHSIVISTYSYEGTMAFTAPLVIRDDLGSPPVAVVFANPLGESIIPAFGMPTTITFGGNEPFRRGDCNQDGTVDISDAVSALAQLFIAGTIPTPCRRACDSNDDGAFDVSDPVWLLNYLFVSGSPPPPAPFPGCGTDPVGDILGCAEFAGCP